MPNFFFANFYVILLGTGTGITLKEKNSQYTVYVYF
jgi:hypothetical protein